VQLLKVQIAPSCDGFWWSASMISRCAITKSGYTLMQLQLLVSISRRSLIPR
ncbi:hypothetical protein COCVIDRAFT_85749, partial [Bipolaris victoriae FI3]